MTDSKLCECGHKKETHEIEPPYPCNGVLAVAAAIYDSRPCECKFYRPRPEPEQTEPRGCPTPGACSCPPAPTGEGEEITCDGVYHYSPTPYPCEHEGKPCPLPALNAIEEWVRQHIAKTAYSESDKEELLIPVAGNLIYEYTAALTAQVAAYREALQEIHKVVSAGCPVGEHPDDTFDALSELCAEALK